ncbi:hypothetical protein [Clostridioides sp. ZZV15-6597]|uniref:hypothetical protein n=1 Tax=Clostridioides sp. ZZV15-6597 TaxID=2811500 RepID=UPI001D12F223|nr:hypothetical protein [Clostridioides sp. ZZV15-6597]HBF1820602.1 hypothetical protein [Clostridioides difficile]
MAKHKKKKSSISKKTVKKDNRKNKKESYNKKNEEDLLKLYINFSVAIIFIYSFCKSFECLYNTIMTK